MGGGMQKVYQEPLLVGISLLDTLLHVSSAPHKMTKFVRLENVTSYALTCTSVMISATTLIMAISVNIFTEFTPFHIYDNLVIRKLNHLLQKITLQQLMRTTRKVLTLQMMNAPAVQYFLRKYLILRKVASYIVQKYLISQFHEASYFLDSSLQLQTFNALQKDLQLHITTNNNHVIPYLDHINALLHQAVATCKAATQVSKPVDLLTKKEKIPPGKSVEHQWRFKKTVKSPGRKKNGSILRYRICVDTFMYLFT